LFVISSPSAQSPSSQKSATSDLLDQSALATLAQRLVEAAKKAGADAADAIAVRGVSQGVEVRDGQVEESERSEGDDVGLRVFVGKRQAVVSTNDISGDGAMRLAERAVAMARVAPDDDFVGLADPSLLAKQFPELDLLDPQMPSTAELEQRAQEAEAAGLAVKGVAKSGGASASCGIGGMVLVTSTGFHGSYLRSSQGISMMAIAGEGTGMERDYDFTSAIHASDLHAPAEIGRSAGERTIARLNPRKVATCKVPVVFVPRISGSLVGHLVGAANGASIARRTSFLQDRLGEAVFGEGVAIIDDPLRRRGLRSRPFDGEGVRVERRELVSNGALNQWIAESASARQLGILPTGHAARGAGGAPGASPSNLYMAAGTRSREQLLAAFPEAVLVVELIGHGINGVTGDYSRGAVGFMVRGGEVAEPVAEITIASNLKDMFATLEPASDLELRRGMDAPTILIPEMTVAAA
jgi:PmbA protein